MAAITPVETGFGDGVAASAPPNVPGIPTFNSNEQFRITVSNDVLSFVSSQGTSAIDIPDGFYTPAGLATQLATSMNADGTLTGGTITFLVTYNTTTNKFTIDSQTGNTIALTFATSDAAATFGFTADASAAVSIVSDTPAESVGTLTIDITANGNDDDAVYAVYDNTQANYITATGGTSGSEVWQTLANWNSGGASGRLSIHSLTEFTGYTYKVEAKNPLNVESVFSSNSVSFLTNTLVDWSTISDEIERETPTGNTKIKLSGVTISRVDYDVYSAGGYGAIAVKFVLQNNSNTPSSVGIEFSEDQSSYSTGTHYFTITSSNDVIRFTSDQGTADIDVPDGDYDTAAALATALQVAMNADNTLTGTGTITFSVTHSSSTGKYTIDAGSTHTILIDFWNSDGAYTFGFNDSTTAAQTNVSDESRGVSPRTLSASESGIEHTIYWDSYTDAGRSEKDSIVSVRLTPYDLTALAGDAGAVVVSDNFAVDNRPQQLSLLNDDTFEFDKGQTPKFSAIMKPIRAGTVLYFRIIINDNDDVAVINADSSEVVAGWFYQQSGSGYTAAPEGGISAQYIDGVNKIRFTPQSNLTQDNDRPYKITMTQGETRHRG